MNTFKEGDRVHHAQHGSAVVVRVDEDRKLVGIKPDNYPSNRYTHVHPVSLTHEPKPRKFKIGDRVSHTKGLHRDGTVADYDKVSGLYTVHLGAYRAYRALEHQIKVPVPEPKFNVRVLFTNGNEVNAGDKFQQHAESYLQNLTDWDTIESITINRVKG